MAERAHSELGGPDRLAAWLPVGGRVAVRGVVVRGHRVASGLAGDSPYPAGTIECQIPFFRRLGLDLGAFYPGTLNVSIRPYVFALRRPEFTFRQVRWTDLNPPEDFTFTRCLVRFRGAEYAGWVYYPHPETKIRHFQDPSILEIIAPFIPDIKYGDTVDIVLNSAELAVTGSGLAVNT